MKTLSIIGIVFGAILIIWSIIAGTSEGKISIEEFFLVSVSGGVYLVILSVMGLRKK